MEEPEELGVEAVVVEEMVEELQVGMEELVDGMVEEAEQELEIDLLIHHILEMEELAGLMEEEVEEQDIMIGIVIGKLYGLLDMEELKVLMEELEEMGYPTIEMELLRLRLELMVQIPGLTRQFLLIVEDMD